MQSGKCSILSVILAAFILGMVAIMLAAMMPPHEVARKVTCQNNLKQCIQALKMYSDDYDGQLPSSYLVNRSKQWNPIDSYAFISRPGKLPPGPKQRRHTWSQILYDNIKNKDVMWCPSDKVDKTDPDAQTSYWYKLANDKAWYGVGCAKPRRSMNDYVFESDQLAFYERLGWHFGDEKGLRNNVQINAAFMDTHVETILIRNATSGDPMNCAANADGEPMYYNQYNGPQGETKLDTGPAKHTDPAIYSDKL